jgi:hypothetical protein
VSHRGSRGRGRRGRRAQCRCGNPVAVSQVTTVWPNGEDGSLDFTRPRYAHPGCLAPQVAAQRLTCVHKDNPCTLCGLVLL